MGLHALHFLIRFRNHYQLPFTEAVGNMVYFGVSDTAKGRLDSLTNT